MSDLARERAIELEIENADLRLRVVELEAERDLWKERYEDERRDHQATIQHCDRAMDEWSA